MLCVWRPIPRRPGPDRPTRMAGRRAIAKGGEECQRSGSARPAGWHLCRVASRLRHCKGCWCNREHTSSWRHEAHSAPGPPWLSSRKGWVTWSAKLPSTSLTSAEWSRIGRRTVSALLAVPRRRGTGRRWRLELKLAQIGAPLAPSSYTGVLSFSP